jgi:hypothetical protein
MRNTLQKLFLLFIKTSPKQKRKSRKSKGQSMVEFAILLPLLLMLFTGMVEFGFMLNTYLSLLDATRQAARDCSNKNPFRIDETNTKVDDLDFYPYCAGIVVATLDPSLATPPDPNARRIVMDVSRDDVLVSVVRVTVDSLTNTISTIDRLPVGFEFYSLYGNADSAYDNTAIENYMTQDGTLPVQTGILIIEVTYNYEGVLKLPWVEAFMSPDNPVTLHASTIMPLVAAKP